MKKKKVYISGRISGEPREECKAKFERACQEAKAQGYDPMSPWQNGLPENAPWEEQMKADIRMMMLCDEVWALPDYWKSRGANIEVKLAYNLGMTVKYPKA